CFGRTVLLDRDGLTEAVEITERLKAVALSDDFRVMLRLCQGLPSKTEGSLRFGNESVRVGAVTQLGFCHSMDERMRFDAIGRNAHLIARKTGGSRTDKRVKHPKHASIPFSKQTFHPLRREPRAVAKPSVNRQPHVVEEVGGVPDSL